MTTVNSRFAIVCVMRARDVIVVARRRASLTQQELARRMGVPQATIARWESGFSEPKFRSVQEAVAACRLDLMLDFANADEGSWNSLIFEQLRLTPAERVRKLSRGHFDRLGVLKLVGDARVRAIVVGETAGALHGWPLMLNGPGGIDLLVRGEDKSHVKEALAQAANPERVRLLDLLPGTWGYGDLTRNCIPMDIDGTVVQIGALIDLLRVAHSEQGGFSGEFALALDATLQLTERLRNSGDTGPHKLTEQQARREADTWLARQTAA